MVRSSVFSVERFGDGHFPGNRVDDVDVAGRLVSARSRYAVPDLDLLVLVGSDLWRKAQGIGA